MVAGTPSCVTVGPSVGPAMGPFVGQAMGPSVGRPMVELKDHEQPLPWLHLIEVTL